MTRADKQHVFQVHNWTVEQTVSWLAESVELQQYAQNFYANAVNGSVLPRYELMMLRRHNIVIVFLQLRSAHAFVTLGANEQNNMTVQPHAILLWSWLECFSNSGYVLFYYSQYLGFFNHFDFFFGVF